MLTRYGPGNGLYGAKKMRNDSIGFFWDDTPPPKPPKAVTLKRMPPKPTWLEPDYLPGLEEALLFAAGIGPIQHMTVEEIMQAHINNEEMILDVECYSNYFLAMFMSTKSRKVAFVEATEDTPLDRAKLSWLLSGFTSIGFNSISYDIPMCRIALTGASTEKLKECSDKIIQEEIRGSDVARAMKAPAVKHDHIDLIEVAPLFAGLKTYAGRMHSKKMQDLPFHPATRLNAGQLAITRYYCANDCTNTLDMREYLREQIDLRVELSNQYKVDLRSKSDAQIAEAVIGSELEGILGYRPKRPTIEVGTVYKYRVPDFLKFQTPLMNWALDTIRRADFIVDYTGSIGLPPEVKDLDLTIANSIYRMGIGGLHSSESCQAHHTNKDYIIIDKDVTSYYPFIILNQQLFPSHLGPAFLRVFGGIVQRRVDAKRMGMAVTADSLKIVVNGTFGKLGSKWSIFYSPDLLIQTTVTGQLSLLMLIERLELAGINVVSANTDGIVIKVPRKALELFNAIVAQWEQETNFQTEETRYMALYSRDVNNYIAIKQKEVKNADGTVSWIEEPDGTKNKGAYANPWASKKNLAMRMHKNPTTTICVEAVEAFLTKGVPVEQTIHADKDITKFVTVRSVRGGAVKVWNRTLPDHSSQEELVRMAGFSPWYGDSWKHAEASDRGATTFEGAYNQAVSMLSEPGACDYIGKSVRWYYGKNVEGEMVYATTGNKVPRSDGAVPLMELNDNFPEDLDHDWYVEEARRILVQIAAMPAEAA